MSAVAVPEVPESLATAAASMVREYLSKARLHTAGNEAELRGLIAGELDRRRIKFVRDVEMQPVFANSTSAASFVLCAPFFLPGEGLVVVTAHGGMGSEALGMLRLLLRHPDTRGAVVVANLLRSQRVPTGIAGKPIRTLDLKWGRE